MSIERSIDIPPGAILITPEQAVALLQVSREILDEWPDQHLLYMSAYPAEVMAQYGLTTLDVPFLAKPFTRKELLAKVNEALAPVKSGSVIRRNVGDS